METSHPPIPFDPQGLVALHFLSAKRCRSRRPVLPATMGSQQKVSRPSAESSDLFWHNQMLFTRTFIVGIDPCFQFGGTQQLVRFRDGPLAMDPLRFNRVEPRTCARQVADDDAHARGTPL